MLAVGPTPSCAELLYGTSAGILCAQFGCLIGPSFVRQGLQSPWLQINRCADQSVCVQGASQICGKIEQAPRAVAKQLTEYHASPRKPLQVGLYLGAGLRAHDSHSRAVLSAGYRLQHIRLSSMPLLAPAPLKQGCYLLYLTRLSRINFSLYGP